MIKDIKGIADIIGKEAVEEIVNKEWKTAELPTKEDLAKEESESPKARSNINSRKNLVQYNKKKSKEVKEKAVKNLRTAKKRAVVNPFDYIILESDEKRMLLKTFLPVRQILAEADEEEYFYRMINSFFSDLDEEELSASDIEDIVTLALNRVMIDRMLFASREHPNKLLDYAASIERFKKQSKELKANLANRRSDRLDPRAKQNFSIVDLVHAYDDKRKAELEARRDRAIERKQRYKKGNIRKHAE